MWSEICKYRDFKLDFIQRHCDISFDIAEHRLGCDKCLGKYGSLMNNNSKLAVSNSRYVY